MTGSQDSPSPKANKERVNLRLLVCKWRFSALPLRVYIIVHLRCGSRKPPFSTQNTLIEKVCDHAETLFVLGLWCVFVHSARCALFASPHQNGLRFLRCVVPHLPSVGGACSKILQLAGIFVRAVVRIAPSARAGRAVPSGQGLVGSEY